MSSDELKIEAPPSPRLDSTQLVAGHTSRRHLLPRRTRVLWAKTVRSFYFAFVGLAYLFRTQRNARLELAIGAAACAVGGWVRISRIEWAVIVFTIALVLILEGLNTAV